MFHFIYVHLSKFTQVVGFSFSGQPGLGGYFIQKLFSRMIMFTVLCSKLPDAFVPLKKQ
jgi:hypothetical protein